MRLQTCNDSSDLLADQIERIVQLRTSGMVRGLHVRILGGEVVLSGRANSYYTKQLATHAALAAITKDARLKNEIDVC
jgi:hypothetical protein